MMLIIQEIMKRQILSREYVTSFILNRGVGWGVAENLLINSRNLQFFHCQRCLFHQANNISMTECVA